MDRKEKILFNRVWSNMQREFFPYAPKRISTEKIKQMKLHTRREIRNSSLGSIMGDILLDDFINKTNMVVSAIQIIIFAIQTSPSRKVIRKKIDSMLRRLKRSKDKGIASVEIDRDRMEEILSTARPNSNKERLISW